MMREGHRRFPSSPLPLSSSSRSPSESSPEGTEKRPRGRRLLAALAPVLLLSLRQITRFSMFRTYTWGDFTARPQRLGIVNFVDGLDASLWGVYSIHKQMKKFGMLPTIEHIVVVSQDLSPKSRKLLEKWLGPEQVREINRNVIVDKIPDGLRKEDFLKTEAFNMTEFDKLIVLDSSVFIRQNIMHWFDHPTPASTQTSGVIEWNTDAMVIEPDTRLYNEILHYIPRSRGWNVSADKGKDTWNSNDGLRGFMGAFLTSNATDHSMFTMSYSSTALSSDLEDARTNNYYWRFRPWVIETVHFTRHKPWKHSTHTHNPSVCALLREWVISVADAPIKELPALPDFLRTCGKNPTEEDIRIQKRREARLAE